jgi:hypothetical protein
MGRLDIPPLRREFALLTRFLAAVRRQSLNVRRNRRDILDIAMPTPRCSFEEQCSSCFRGTLTKASVEVNDVGAGGKAGCRCTAMLLCSLGLTSRESREDRSQIRSVYAVSMTRDFAMGVVDGYSGLIVRGRRGRPVGEPKAH